MSSAIRMWNKISPFNGLGALGSAEDIKQASESMRPEDFEKWLPMILSGLIAANAITREQIKEIYCKLSPLIASRPVVQQAFAQYAPPGACTTPGSQAPPLPPAEPKVNWLLWGGVAVGVLAALGGLYWYMNKNKR